MKRREVITIVAAVVVIGLLYAVLKLSAGGNSKSANRSPMPSNKSEGSAPSAVKEQPAQRPRVKPPSKGPGDTPNFLSDADLERLLKEAVDFKLTERRDGLTYQVEESQPYSGWVKDMYDSGQVDLLWQVKGGKLDGLSIHWLENGQKRRATTFKDGKQHGLQTEWSLNKEHIFQQTNWKAAEYSDGSPRTVKHGLQTNWYENGQKKQEVPYKDDKKHGLSKSWHENGQKNYEITYKDGEKVSTKYWNSKGEEVETAEEAMK